MSQRIDDRANVHHLDRVAHTHRAGFPIDVNFNGVDRGVEVARGVVSMRLLGVRAAHFHRRAAAEAYRDLLKSSRLLARYESVI